MDKDPDNFLNSIIVKYVIAPILVIIGMLAVGSLIDGALKTNNAFTFILGAAGGIGVIGYYYSKLWKHGE